MYTHVIRHVIQAERHEMRVTIRLPDDLGEDVKRRTDNVSRYVTDALTEKIEREERRRARTALLDMAGGESVDPTLHEQNQQMRREEDRSPSAREVG